MTAKVQAIKDIKDDLRKDGKTFIAFREELNAPIKELVDEQLKAQKKLKKSWCLSTWSVPRKKRRRGLYELVASCFFTRSGNVKLINIH